MTTGVLRAVLVRPLTAIAGFSLILGLLVALAYGFSRDPGRIDSPLVGRPAPGLALAALDGSVVDLAGLRGRPVVVNFWASWCIPCRDEAPLLRQAAARYRDRVAFLGVVYQDGQESARAFLDRYGLDYPSLVDPDGRTSIDYGVYGIPETFFIDAAGIIRAKQIGPLDAASLDGRIQELVE